MGPNKTINIILSNSPIFSQNKGCSALAYSTIQLIDEICKENGIEYKLFSTGILKQSSRGKLNIGDKKIEFENISNPLVMNIKGALANILYFNKFYKSCKTFKAADLLLDVGEGDSFSDIYGNYRYRYITQWNKTAKRFNIPVVRLPQTIGPFKNTSIQKHAVSLMEQSQLTMARDFQSLEYTHSLSSDIKSDEYIDLAFALPYKKYNFDPSKNHIGINISGLLWHGGYLQNNQFNLRADYQELILTIIDRLLKEDDSTQIHLISHVFDITSDHVENDFKVCSELYKKLNSHRVTLAPPTFDPIEVKSYIAGMDFFIGARMHSTIAAFSAKVPVIPMAYSRKFNGLFINTLHYPFMSDLVSQEKDEVINLITNSYKDRDTLRLQIEESHKEVINSRISKLKSDLADIIKQYAK